MTSAMRISITPLFHLFMSGSIRASVRMKPAEVAAAMRTVPEISWGNMLNLDDFADISGKELVGFTSLPKDLKNGGPKYSLPVV